jgi:glycosyltransferase involved in cell wall biosynthesis
LIFGFARRRWGRSKHTEVQIIAALKQADAGRMVDDAGGGSCLGACCEGIIRKRLDRVIVHSPCENEENSSVLQMADVLLLPTKGRPSLNSIPSKLISYLLSGRPVIAAVLPESDTAMTILETRAAWIVNHDSPDMIARAIGTASEQPREILSHLGTAGREYARRNLTRESTLPRVISVISRAASLQREDEKSEQGVSQCL